MRPVRIVRPAVLLVLTVPVVRHHAAAAVLSMVLRAEAAPRAVRNRAAVPNTVHSQEPVPSMVRNRAAVQNTVPRQEPVPNRAAAAKLAV